MPLAQLQKIPKRFKLSYYLPICNDARVKSIKNENEYRSGKLETALLFTEKVTETIVSVF
jgi:hypothetical protein